MSAPLSPRLLKGGIVLLDPASGAVLRSIPLQYNPDSVTRSFQVQAQGDGGDGGRSDVFRIKAPPVESFKVEAELDATDALERNDQEAVRLGIQPQLAALEAIAYPDSARLIENDRLLGSGVLEVTPIEAPLALFVWSRSRVLPVRLTDLSVTEEAFDAGLNPIRAKVSLGLRVLSVHDVGFSHRAASLFLAYQQQKEQWAARAGRGLGALGLEGIP